MGTGNPGTDDWYYRKQGGDRYFEFGPFTWEKLFILYMKGEIDADTEVRGCQFPWAPLRAFLPGSKFNLKIQASRILYLARRGLQWFRSLPREQKLITVGICLIVVYFVVHNVIYSKPKMSQAPQTRQLFRTSEAAPGTPRPSGARSSRGTHPLQEALTSAEVLRLTNVTRAENGVHELKESFLLNAIASERAKDMFEKQYFDHVSPTGEKASDIAQKVGYRYKRFGENIASGSFLNNREIINDWMQSPGHRKNLLSNQFEEIGVAVMKGRLEGGEGWIAVQVFGRQSPPVGEAR
ncbi:MAG: CAP domain-containing protein [Syntrophorhabdaceae bacterium]|nr:CAP domain-containing protein [Syntrophorhabdaceae bacterium]HBL22813.1 hypothetical protein [Deltaproteobacteria bacterium]